MRESTERAIRGHPSSFTSFGYFSTKRRMIAVPLAQHRLRNRLGRSTSEDAHAASQSSVSKQLRGEHARRIAAFDHRRASTVSEDRRRFLSV